MESSQGMHAKVSAKGWVVIPAALRRRYGLKPGMSVEFRAEGDHIIVVPRESDIVEDLFGKLAGPISLTEALLEDRALELQREETSLRTG
jgi:AbrB family looped-hinge helix DNA binding protein